MPDFNQNSFINRLRAEDGLEYSLCETSSSHFMLFDGVYASNKQTEGDSSS